MCQQELDGPREGGRGGGGKGGLEGGWRAFTLDAGTMCLPKGLNTVFRKKEKQNMQCHTSLPARRFNERENRSENVQVHTCTHLHPPREMSLISGFTAGHRSSARRDAALSQAECQVTTYSETCGSSAINRTHKHTPCLSLSQTHTHTVGAYVIKRSIAKNQSETHGRVIKEYEMKSHVKTSQTWTRRQSRRKRPRQQQSAHPDRKRTRAAKTGVCNQLISMACKCLACIINMRAC